MERKKTRRCETRTAMPVRRSPGGKRAGLSLLLTAGIMLFCCLTVFAEQPSWQDAYLDYAQKALGVSQDVVFYLINLDGDDIPEMVINYGSADKKEEICYWDRNQLSSATYDYYGCSYIPGSSVLRISGGSEGAFYVKTYRLENGRFLMVGDGTYIMNRDNLEYDENGNFLMNDQFNYTWQGKPVDAETFVQGTQEVFDESLATTPYQQGYDLVGLIEVIRTGDYLNQPDFLPEPETGDGGEGTDPAPVPEPGTESAPAGEGQEPAPLPEPVPQQEAVVTEPAHGNMSFVSSDVSEYPNVKLYFEYTDDAGTPITLYSMTGNIVESIAGGAEIERTIRSIERLEGNQRLSIDIVADKSGSMEYDLPDMQRIMADFVTSLDYSSGDQVEILSFDSYVMYMCTYTQDTSLMLNGISNMTPYGDTALYDALITGVTNAGNQAGARCVIGFTDGADNESIYTAEEVINLALQKEVPVYLIGTWGAEEDTLRYICDRTGGYYWTIDDISDIGEILQRIYAAQKDMYCVEYESDPGTDPYAQRRINCTVGDDAYTASVTNLYFQAAPVIRKTQHASRYELIQADVSWTKANEDCIARGGHLATVTSQEEMNQLISLCEPAGVKYCWMGGYTSERNGTIFGHWITGEPFGFSAWFYSEETKTWEPSRFDRDGTPEFYLMLWKVEDEWSWNDQRDDLLSTGLDYFKGKIGYVCEYES